MEQAATDQLLLSKQMKALQLQYNQLSEERKTIKLIEERIGKLDGLWASFEQNDDEIRLTHGEEKHHYYFVEDFYNQVEKVYKAFKEILMKKYEMLKSNQNEEGEPSNKIEVANGSNKTAMNEVGSQVINDVKVLIRSRSRSLNCLQRFIAAISFDNKSKEYYQTKIQGIEQKWSCFQLDDKDVCSKCNNPEDYGYDPEQIYEVEDAVQDMIISLKEQMNSATDKEDSNTTFNIKNKLPAITIPKFDGDYAKWMQFRDLFTELIDKQPLQKIEKMFYLKTNVYGEAEHLIRHMTVSENNYDVAWKILNERYNNKRLLVSTIIEKFLSQPNLIAGSAKSFKNMYDTTKECILSLENWGLTINGSWDPIMLQILLKKLDKDTYSCYEQTIENRKDIQSLQDFMKFIEMKFQSLEAVGSKPQYLSKGKQMSHQKASSFTTTTSLTKCSICGKEHMINTCPEFLKLAPYERSYQIRRLQLCLNCFKSGHHMKTCYSRGCKKCNLKHNTLLHHDKPLNKTQDSTASDIINQDENKAKAKTATVMLGSSPSQNDGYVYLGTVVGTVIGDNNRSVNCRILLDGGSQENFISERLQKKLKLDSRYRRIDIDGIGNLCFIPTTDRVNVTIKSKYKDFELNIEAQVMKEITQQPSKYYDIKSWNIPKKLDLADPKFNQPQKVDLLLGAETYCDLMRTGRIKLSTDLPSLQETVFGWMVLGKMKTTHSTALTTSISNNQLNDELLKFWECEEIEPVKQMSNADIKCEEFFKATTFRDNGGRFVVNLPILTSSDLLGESRDIALRRFYNLERKLSKDFELKRQYVLFMKEYKELGHMTEVCERDISKSHYFLPHHCVIKQESSTTKLRVVFDGSCKTSSNLSLNDIMMKGPKVQHDLFNILLRFRTYKYVITADIKQMYRQIKVSNEDRHLQLILWRSDPKDKIRVYQLNTVTYGTRAAPYLATRCLKQLGDIEELKYPRGVKALEDFYVDDVITGSDSIFETLEIKKELITILKSAQFHLHKWGSNDERLLEDIPEEYKEKEKIFKNDESGFIKTLGLSWQPVPDIFAFVTSWPDTEDKLTKRKVVSDVARLFDPLGLVNPVIVTAKIFIQKLWKLKLDWDDELDEECKAEWLEYRHELSTLNQLRISRYVFINPESIIRTELHGFGDASEKAYGGAVYIRTIEKTGQITCKLLCSKSKIAPIKFLTIPRLELCAALSITRLMAKVKNSIRQQIDEVYLWSDSQIVLSRLKNELLMLKTYELNRITKILNKSEAKQWNFVQSKNNPADLLSRGASPNHLKFSELWFHGPQFLKQTETHWPNRDVNIIQLEKDEKKASFVTVIKEITPKKEHPIYLINHRNSFMFFVRTLAYVLRAINKFKKSPGDDNSNFAWLSTKEINDSLLTIVKESQNQYFSDEIKQLTSDFKVNKKSRLASLSPFIDMKGILRVGGRLDNALINYDAKYPMLISGNDPLSSLLLTYLHKKNLHAGPLALSTIARQRYWITQGRERSRLVVKNCIQCSKAKPQLLQQMMGSLPNERVLPARAFLNTGVDFCGPIWTHFHARGKKPQKSYIAVFCCFVTKAVHMEVVSDLTTDAFLGALKRFMARRGFCRNIFCDNATNFVGAKNKLAELQILFRQNKIQEQIGNCCSENGIQFHFSPPRSPHFGGLWEAAVKSAKKLLQHTLVSSSLTFEELSTVVAEAEAILNSRPLTPLSSNPDDYSVLTPGHFLIGEPLTTIPTSDVSESRMASLSRWKLVSYLSQELWKRWTKEYLSELQKRHKWKEAVKNLKPGSFVLIKDDNAPPLKWHMGRIEEAIQGTDGLVRVATVRTANGVYKRAVHNLAPLPIEEDDDIDKDIKSKNTEVKRKNSLLIQESQNKKLRVGGSGHQPFEQIPNDLNNTFPN